MAFRLQATSSPGSQVGRHLIPSEWLGSQRPDSPGAEEQVIPTRKASPLGPRCVCALSAGSRFLRLASCFPDYLACLPGQEHRLLRHPGSVRLHEGRVRTQHLLVGWQSRNGAAHWRPRAPAQASSPRAGAPCVRGTALRPELMRVSQEGTSRRGCLPSALGLVPGGQDVGARLASFFGVSSPVGEG